MQARVSQLALKPGETSQEVQIRGNGGISKKSSSPKAKRKLGVLFIQFFPKIYYSVRSAPKVISDRT